MSWEFTVYKVGEGLTGDVVWGNGIVTAHLHIAKLRAKKRRRKFMNFMFASNKIIQTREKSKSQNETIQPFKMMTYSQEHQNKALHLYARICMVRFKLESRVRGRVKAQKKIIHAQYPEHTKHQDTHINATIQYNSVHVL